jgi:glucose/arabinose dehydrogenase
VAALAAVAAVPAPAAAVVVTAPDLENRTLAVGLDTPTAIAWTPDGRLLIAEKEGLVRLVDRRSAPLGRVILDISGRVSSRDDSGLLGLEVDRDFARNGFIYVSYAFDPNPAAPGAAKAGRLSRFKLTAAGKIVRGRRGEKVILGRGSRSPCPPPANDVDCIPTDEGYHTIAAVRAAADGTLWVSTGDGSGSPSASRAALRAYDEESLSGKLLHINRKGRGLRRHPFCPQERNLDLVCTKVFAMGFRNPFRFSLAPDGAPIVGDVGWGLREEIDVVEGGRNYGWPCYEGELRTPGFDAFQTCQQVYAQEGTPDAPVRSAHEYERPPDGAAVIAGPLFTESAPPPFANAFFFGDYGMGNLFRLTGGLGYSARKVETIATGWRGVDLRLGPDGSLVYVDIAEGVVAAIAHAPANRTPVPSVQAAPTFGALPLRVNLRAAVQDPDGDELSYHWRLGDGERASGRTVRHTYRKRGTYTVRLLVRDRHGARALAATHVFAGNTPPRGARILSPRDGYRYVTGRLVRLRAAARDPGEGRLRGRALRWRLVLRHDDHNHYVGQGFGREFSFRPLRDHDANSYYQVSVVAIDRHGLSQSEPPHQITLRPNTTKLTLDSEPAGAPITYGSVELDAPAVRTVAVGHRTTVTAAPTFESDGVTYRFSSWRDGAPRRRRIVIGPRPSRLTALYVAAG